MIAPEILAAAHDLGATVVLRAGRLAVEGASRLTDELRAEIRAHGRDLLDVLRSLPDDLRAWGPAARYVLAGLKRAGLDRATARAVVVEVWDGATEPRRAALWGALAARGVPDAEDLALRVWAAATTEKPGDLGAVS